MKTEISNELIKEMVEVLDSEGEYTISEKIKAEAPDLFKPKWEVGKWYTHKANGSIFCLTKKKGNDNNDGYGVNFYGEWVDSDNNLGWSTTSCMREATKEEVEAALIKEAKKRGFKKGIEIERTFNHNYSKIGEKETITEGTFTWTGELLEFGYWIFKDGKWATIIEQVKEVTIEEIQEKYGCKIKIVE